MTTQAECLRLAAKAEARAARGARNAAQIAARRGASDPVAVLALHRADLDRQSAANWRVMASTHP
ncbi:hypothetical protein [Aureimonas endophytica]|nr:hypothetical protein [Aureimonas endophytica]